MTLKKDTFLIIRNKNNGKFRTYQLPRGQKLKPAEDWTGGWIYSCTKVDNIFGGYVFHESDEELWFEDLTEQEVDALIVVMQS